MRQRVVLPALMAATFSTFLASCRSVPDQDEYQPKANLQSGSTIILSQHVALPEISGAALCGDPAQPKVALVSDQSTDVALLPFTPWPALPAYLQLQEFIGWPDDLTNGSQFEGIACDKAGRMFVLQESAPQQVDINSSIYIVDPRLHKFLSKIILKIPQNSELYTKWQAEPNSRAEGLVLLNNGHILVLKEKKSTTLVEFAKEGEGPEGFTAGMGINLTTTFSFDLAQERQIFVPIKFWYASEETALLLGDGSELALDTAGNLLLLSDQGRLVGLVDTPLRPAAAATTFSLRSLWKLPPVMEKAEGLIARDMHLFVSSDLNGSGPNFFKIKLD